MLGGNFDPVPACLSVTTCPERQRRCAELSVTPIPQPPAAAPIRSEATGGESNSLILLEEWQKRLPPKRWVARERAPSPEAAEAGEGWDGGG